MEGNVKYKLDTKTEGKPENHGEKSGSQGAQEDWGTGTGDTGDTGLKRGRKQTNQQRASEQHKLKYKLN